MSSSPALPRERRLGLIVAIGLAALVAAVLIPGSPLHVSDWLFWQPKYEGRSARQWHAALADPNPDARAKAAFALGSLNTSATGSVPKLTTLFRTDPDPDVRVAAVASLGKMYPATKGIVPELTAGLSDPDLSVRMYCLVALFRLKQDARPALPAITAAATDEDNDVRPGQFLITVRQMALRTLGAVAEGTPEAVATLSASIEGQPAPDETREIVVTGLGAAGPHAASAAPLVRSLLRDPHPDVRQAAEGAIARMGVSRDGPSVTDEFDGLHLPAAEQKRLWALEHAGNELNAYAFAPLADALRAADPVALAEFFAPDFVGTDLGEPTRVASAGFADVVRLQDSGRPPVPLTRAAAVAKLMDLRKVFVGTPKVRMVIATARPKDAANPDGLWEGKTQLRMFGEHAPGAPAEVNATVRYETTKPGEKEMAAGGWLKALHVSQVAVAKSPAPLFVERAKARGLNTALHDNWTTEPMNVITGGAFVTDFDRDGYLDVLITDKTGNYLYRGGANGQFTDVTQQVGLPRQVVMTTAACWADLDGDGWDDLILDTRVYRNDAGKRFTDHTEQCQLPLPPDASNILVADYDRDGKLDLYVARSGQPGNLSWLQGRSNDPVGNRMLHNLGGWKFEDATKKTGTRGGFRSAFTAAWMDVNNDGWPDLYVPNEFGDGVLLVNQQNGTFREQLLADRPVDFGTMGMAVGDMNNDGHIDIYSADMYSKAGTRVIGNMKPDSYPPKVMEKFRRFVSGSQLHLNQGGLKFESVGAEKQLASVGWAYGPALADLDGDGFLDIYATAGYISRDRDKPDG